MMFERALVRIEPGLMNIPVRRTLSLEVPAISEGFNDNVVVQSVL